MARVFKQSAAKHLGLAGRKSVEILSGAAGSRNVTLRLVEIPVPKPGEIPRAPHHHADIEECIFVLAGEGVTFADSGEYPLKAGDTILVPPGEKHVTRNTGNQLLVLLCFFPAADIARSTHEDPPSLQGPGRS
jgi:quercetin dioxygenase-like cupin family protein